MIVTMWVKRKRRSEECLGVEFSEFGKFSWIECEREMNKEGKNPQR